MISQAIMSMIKARSAERLTGVIKKKKVYTEASYGDHRVWRARARQGQELGEKHQEMEGLLRQCRPQSVRT